MLMKADLNAFATTRKETEQYLGRHDSLRQRLRNM